MNEARFVMSDTVWERFAPHLPGKSSDRGVTAQDNRLFLEAVFWRAHWIAMARPSVWIWELE